MSKAHIRRGAFSALCGGAAPGELVEASSVDPRAPAPELCRKCLRRLIAKQGLARARQRRVEAPGTFRHWRRSDTVPPKPATPAVERETIKPGDEYGLWTVLRLVGIEGKDMRVAARCRGLPGRPCGTERVVPARSLRNGHSRSCGCARLTTAAKPARGAVS